MLLFTLMASMVMLMMPVQAQFFFENMFQQGGQQQQPQNAGSDSSWYQQRYADGEQVHILCDGTSTHTLQHGATSIFVHTLSHVYTSHITARVHFRT